MATLFAAALLMFATTACGAEADDSEGVASLDEGGDPTDATGDSEESAEEQALAFAQCMRDNGVDMPDPEVDGDGNLRMRAGGGLSIDEGAMEEAMEACEDLRPDFGSQMTPEDQSEMQDRLLAYAECMRDNGIDMPDPEFDEGMVRFGPPEGIDPEDPEFQAAQETCQEEVGMGEGMAVPGQDAR
jgi:hypothetical protein